MWLIELLSTPGFDWFPFLSLKNYSLVMTFGGFQVLPQLVGALCNPVRLDDAPSQRSINRKELGIATDHKPTATLPQELSGTKDKIQKDEIHNVIY